MSSEVSRRAACDRCRGQKLRCVRQSNNFGRPCDRCRKAGAECTNTQLFRQKFPPGEPPAPISFVHAPARTALVVDTPQNSQPSTERTVGQSSFTKSDQRAKLPIIANNQSNFLPKQNHGQSLYNRERCLHHRFSVDTAIISGATSFGNSVTHLDEARSVVTPRKLSDEHSILFSPSSRSHGQASSKPSSSDFTDILPFEFGHNGEESINGSFSSGPATWIPPAPMLIENDASVIEQNSQPKVPSIGSTSEGLQCLTELSARLIKDAHEFGMNKKTLGDIITFSPSSSHQTTSLPKNAIGSVLDHSQALLNILCSLRDLQAAAVAAGCTTDGKSPGGSDCSYSDLWEMNDFPFDSANGGSMSQLNAEPSSNRHKAAVNVFPNHADGERAVQQTSTHRTPLDMGATLTALTCYTWLLQTYDIIFQRVQATLDAADAVTAIPGLIPGLTVGGFNLDERKDLQLEIFLQISARMMTRIEAVLGIVDDPPTSVLSVSDDRRLLGSRETGALIELIFQQAGENGGLATRVRQTVDSIRGMLHTSST